MICDGISRLVFNTQMINLAETIGCSITICKLSTDEVTRKRHLTVGGDLLSKILKLDYMRDKKETQLMIGS